MDDGRRNVWSNVHACEDVRVCFIRRGGRGEGVQKQIKSNKILQNGGVFQGRMVILFARKQPPQVFCKKVVLGNFAKFTGKHMCQSLYFNNGCFPVNFAKFPRTPVLQNTSDGDFICHHFLYCFRFPISPKNKKYSNLHFLINYRSSHPKCSIKKIFLKKFEKFPGKELELYLKETPTQV